MHIERIKGRNFLTLGEFELDLANQGLIAVQGVNEDDPSAQSNGAGKSSLIDALCWVLYGVTARGVSGDDVVNNTVGKDCMIEVFVRDGNYRYHIARYRKDRQFKNDLFLRIHDDVTGVDIDLTKGTVKLTQDEIVKLLGCPQEVFASAIYMGQEKMPDLPAMTDKHLKLLIEEAAGIERVQAAYELARKRALNLGKEVEKLQSQREAKLKHIETLETLIQSLVIQENDWTAEQASKIVLKKRELAEGEVELKRLNAMLMSVDEAAIIVERDAIRAKIDGLKHEQTQLAELTEELRQIERQEASIATTVTTLTQEVRTLKSRFEAVENQVGQPCSECGKSYCEEDLHDAKRLAKDKLIAQVTKLKSAKQSHEEIVGKRTVKLAEIQFFKDSMSDVSTLNRALQAITERLSEIDRLKTQTHTQARQVTTLHNEVAQLIAEDNPHIKTRLETELRHKDANDELRWLNHEIEKQEKQVTLLNQAIEVFSPAGVRAHILDSVTPFLNDRTAKYLGQLSDGTISAAWNTLTLNAKGELKENFKILVEKRNAAKLFAGLSGGEKRKVRLATAWALNDLVASRAAKPIDLFIADEVDHALDESGLERLMVLLEEQAKERGTVLVISHNSLKSWIDSVVTIRNKGGLSTVEVET
jgi:DNA repair exonuclease SbcCD ATPase subunit